MSADYYPDDPRVPMSAEQYVASRIAAGDGPVEAVRLPRKSRILLLAGKPGVTMGDVRRCRWLCRWGAQQDRARVRNGRVSISSGLIGVTAFTRRGVLRKAAILRTDDTEGE